MAIASEPELKHTDISRRQPPGREGKTVFAALLFLAVVYVSLAIHLSRLGAFWSPDSGARFAMIRNWAEYGSLIHWYYPNADIDPTGQIHPLAYFLFHLPHGYCAMYEPLFPLFCGMTYRIFGFGGLTVIPVLCGLGTALITYATARRLELRSRVLLPLVVGLGTPLLIYSVVFWDHVTMMLLAALAGYWMLRGLQENRVLFCAWSGATLGLGIWIHELMLALFLAVLLASLPVAWHRPGRRLVMGLIAGFIPLAMLWAGANWAIYGSLGGPHLSANMGGNAADHPFSLSILLDQQQLTERWWEELTGTMTGGLMITNAHADLFPLFRVLAVLLTGYMVTTWLAGAAWRFAPLLSLTAAGLAVYLVVQVHWANGLFQATPLFIPALAISWDAIKKRGGRTEGEPTGTPELRPESLFYAWVSRATWLYIIMILINPMLPGVDWGSRYLLPVLPFLVLLAAHALEEQYQASGPRWRWVVAGSAVALVGISVFCQFEGLMMIRRNILYNREVNERVRALTSPVVVFSNIGMGPELTAVSLPQQQFMVRSDEDLRLFLAILRKRGINEFTYIGNEDGLAPFQNGGLTKTGTQFFHVDRTRQDGEDQEFLHFVLRLPKATAAAKG